MNGAFYIGATGLRTQERALEAVANNIANINTNGYKRAEARFSEMVTPTGGDPSNPALAPDDQISGLSGVMVDSTRDFSQGAMQVTNGALDVAINGDGFLELMGPSGQVLLSRGGSLQVNTDGYLADANGLPLKGMITIPQGLTNITIGAAGKV
jgi:flagellar basal-body rod protein FlgG